MNRKQIKHHIKTEDYFGTLATVLDLARQELEQNKKKPNLSYQIKLLKGLKDDLVYLQNNYKIIKK